MSAETQTQTGLYLYAVVPGRTDVSWPGLGVDKSDVYVVRKGDLAAVVSDVPDRQLRPERRNLAAHQAVLNRLMDEQTVLPVAFGVVADGSREIEAMLQSQHDTLIRELDHVRNKVEMGLKIQWDVPNIFEHMVELDDELRDARDELYADGRQPSQDGKIELGQLFEEVLNRRRDQCASRVVQALEAKGYEIKRLTPRDEKTVLNLACLLGRDQRQAFEQTVREVAGEFDDTYVFNLDGPWPPSNFTEVRVKLER